MNENTEQKITFTRKEKEFIAYFNTLIAGGFRVVLKEFTKLFGVIIILYIPVIALLLTVLYRLK